MRRSPAWSSSQRIGYLVRAVPPHGEHRQLAPSSCRTSLPRRRAPPGARQPPCPPVLWGLLVRAVRCFHDSHSEGSETALPWCSAHPRSKNYIEEASEWSPPTNHAYLLNIADRFARMQHVPDWRTAAAGSSEGDAEIGPRLPPHLPPPPHLRPPPPPRRPCRRRDGGVDVDLRPDATRQTGGNGDEDYQQPRHLPSATGHSGLSVPPGRGGRGRSGGRVTKAILATAQGGPASFSSRARHSSTVSCGTRRTRSAPGRDPGRAHVVSEGAGSVASPVEGAGGGVQPHLGHSTSCDGLPRTQLCSPGVIASWTRRIRVMGVGGCGSCNACGESTKALCRGCDRHLCLSCAKSKNACGAL